jgi:hypothetical protein
VQYIFFKPKMSAVLQTVVQPFDSFLIGTMKLGQPYQRFAFGWIATTAAVWWMQPTSMFEHGNPRPFELFADGEASVGPTKFPWWTPGLVTGALFSTFV